MEIECNCLAEYHGEKDYCEALITDVLSSTFCSKNDNCPFKLSKQLQQLKAENEELHRRQNVFNILKKIDKYKQCLDEIEEYLNQYAMLGKLNIKYLLQLIKQAKEGK